MDEVTSAMIAGETDPETKAILEHVKLRKRWNDVLVGVAKTAFETLHGGFCVYQLFREGGLR